MSAISELQAFEPRKMDVFPSAMGNLLVVAYFEQKACVEIYCDINGRFDAVFEIDGVENIAIDDKSFDEIRQFLGSEMWRIKNSFGLYIQNIMTPNVAYTLAPLSKTPDQTEEYPSFGRFALPKPGTHFAPTSVNTILWA